MFRTRPRSHPVCLLSPAVLDPTCLRTAQWGLGFPMVDEAEDALLERAQGGDARAYGQLVRLHQRRVFGCAIHMLANAIDADDAVQETFVRAWKALPRFDRRSELSTWLYRICVNVCLNLIRKRKRNEASDIDDPRIPEPEADPVQSNSDPRRALESSEFYRTLAQALDSLSPSLRTTVVLVLIEGVPQKDAAKILGCQEGTIAWRIHEARRRLTKLLDTEPDAFPNSPTLREKAS